MAAAFTMVDALRRAGPNPTRESLMRAATSLDEADNPFLLPGVVVRTTQTSRWPFNTRNAVFLRIDSETLTIASRTTRAIATPSTSIHIMPEFR